MHGVHFLQDMKHINDAIPSHKKSSTSKTKKQKTPEFFASANFSIFKILIFGVFFHNKMPQRFICWLYIKNYFDSCTETISVRDQISISLNILASNSLSLYKTKVLYCDDVHNIYLGHFQSKGWNRCMDIV